MNNTAKTTVTKDDLKDLSVRIGQPLTEKEFRAWCEATGNAPVVMRPGEPAPAPKKTK